MNKFELTDTFKVGHQKIDAEHQELVNIINAMADVVKARDLEASKLKWQQFNKALAQHFVSEDKVMKEFGYTEDNHDNFHSEVMEHLEGLGASCKTGHDWEECLQQILVTLVDDILKHDLNFATHLHSQGYAN